MSESQCDGTLVYVGLGSNLGDPIEQLIDARKRLAQLPMVVSARSSLMYGSTPVGYSSQPDFANCVIELTVLGGYRDFFDNLQQVESQMGRIRDGLNQNAPRVIDIDLLLFGDSHISLDDLIVPHPRMNERLFVLMPLLELNQMMAAKYRDFGDDLFSGQDVWSLAL